MKICKKTQIKQLFCCCCVTFDAALWGTPELDRLWFLQCAPLAAKTTSTPCLLVQQRQGGKQKKVKWEHAREKRALLPSDPIGTGEEASGWMDELCHTSPFLYHQFTLPSLFPASWTSLLKSQLRQDRFLYIYNFACCICGKMEPTAIKKHILVFLICSCGIFLMREDINKEY